MKLLSKHVSELTIDLQVKEILLSKFPDITISGSSGSEYFSQKINNIATSIHCFVTTDFVKDFGEVDIHQMYIYEDIDIELSGTVHNKMIQGSFGTIKLFDSGPVYNEIFFHDFGAILNNNGCNDIIINKIDLYIINYIRNHINYKLINLPDRIQKLLTFI